MPRYTAATESQKTFARVFFKDHDYAAAAVAAGSTSANPKEAGYRLHRHPTVQRLLEELGVKADELVVRDRDVTESEVHDLIDEGIGLARKGRPIIARDGHQARGDKTDKSPKGELLFHPDVPALLKGAEMKGKTIAMFVDKQQITGELEGMSDKELEAMLVSNLTGNPMLLDAICLLEIVIRKVHESDRQLAASDEDGEGVQPTEAESLSSSSEASEVPQGWRH